MILDAFRVSSKEEKVLSASSSGQDAQFVRAEAHRSPWSCQAEISWAKNGWLYSRADMH